MNELDDDFSKVSLQRKYFLSDDQFKEFFVLAQSYIKDKNDFKKRNLFFSFLAFFSPEELDKINSDLLNYDWTAKDILILSAWGIYLKHYGLKRLSSELGQDIPHTAETSYVIEKLLFLISQNILQIEFWQKLVPEINVHLKAYDRNKDQGYAKFATMLKEFVARHQNLFVHKN